MLINKLYISKFHFMLKNLLYFFVIFSVILPHNILSINKKNTLATVGATTLIIGSLCLLTKGKKTLRRSALVIIEVAMGTTLGVLAGAYLIKRYGPDIVDELVKKKINKHLRRSSAKKT